MSTTVSKAVMFKMLGKILFLDMPAARIHGAMKRMSPNRGEILVVDLDGTLISTNASLEILKEMRGEKFATERYEHYKKLVLSGQMSTDEMLLTAHKEIEQLGITKDKYETMVKRIINEGKVRTEIVEAAKYAQTHGKKVYLVTKSAETTAKLFAKRFGFDGGFGAIEQFDANNKMIGLKSIVGDKDTTRNGVQIQTKLGLIKRQLGLRGLFDSRKITMLSDSYFDAVAMRRSGLGVLFVPKDIHSEQKLAKRFGLMDYAVYDENPARIHELKLLLRMPRAASALKKRLAQTMGKRQKRLQKNIARRNFLNRLKRFYHK